MRGNVNPARTIVSHLNLTTSSLANRNISKTIFRIVCRCCSLTTAVEAYKSRGVWDLALIGFIMFMFLIFICANIGILNPFLAKNITKNFFDLKDEASGYTFHKGWALPQCLWCCTFICIHDMIIGVYTSCDLASTYFYFQCISWKFIQKLIQRDRFNIFPSSSWFASL